MVGINRARSREHLVKKILIILAIAMLTSGCSTYRSSFDVGNSRGARGMSVDKADKLIASGEIELYTKTEEKCKGSACRKIFRKKIINDDELPAVQGSPVEINLNGLED